MIFGDRISESPRVPSPWTKARKPASARSSLGTQGDASSSSDGRRRAVGAGRRNISQKSDASTPADTPPLQALPRQSARRNSRSSSSGRAMREKEARSARPDASLADDDNSDSISTPPTDDGDNDGFFCLDADLDVSKMSLGGSELPAQTVAGAEPASAIVRDAHSATHRLAPEPDIRGNLEYKLRILPHTRHRYDRLLTQLKWRLLQGGGQCTYEVGVLDDGDCIGICAHEMLGSLRALASMADDLGAAVSIHRAFQVDGGSESSTSESVSAAGTVALSADQIRARLAEAKLSVADLCACGVSTSHLREMMMFLPPLDENVLRIDLDGVSNVQIKGLDKDALARQPAVVSSTARGTSNGGAEEEGDDVPLGFFSFGADDDEDGLGALGHSSGDTSSPSDDDIDVDNVDGVTYSLSLDEQATRLGIGYQRKATAPRRKCRYNVHSALHRQRIAADEARLGVQSSTDAAMSQNEALPVIASPKTPIGTSMAAQVPATAALETADVVDAPALPPCPCTKLILEVSVSRNLGPDAFIDYASL